ncbi:AraC family transcriptional regulator [Streptomyces sp. NRRL S-1022]|uniref:AraC family transcriptional regulator n=1 Tax=Streptomyces sp. NRRL S-1022 TaxID=1463880 RepID=UPI00131DF591|nr:AraC family transcriptional regulator [Streptomyces sp. NRRL S-1022]
METVDSKVASSETWKALEVERKVVHTTIRAYKHEAREDVRIIAHVQAAYRLQCHDGEGAWKTVTCRAGDACIVPPGRTVLMRWQLLQDEPMEHIHITLPLAAFRRHLDETWHGSEPDLYNLAQLAKPDPVITSAAVALVGAQKAGAGELYADCTAQYLIAHILAPKTVEAHGPLSVRQMDLVRDFVRAHLAGAITLDDLASQLSLSRFHFLRLFKQTTGVTPHQYVTQQRMEAAKYWLRTRRDSVASIGHMCGYTTAAHFSRAFRKHVGVSPSQYRASRARP